jgi:group I intron endonuclease
MVSIEKQKSGIYKILNNINGKFYIGSAKSLSGRWRLHKSQLKNNKHHSIYLQRSFNKYGYSSFSFEILEYCDVTFLIEREQVYLDTLKPHYNIAKIAGNCLGVKHTDPEANYRRGSWSRGKFGKDSVSSKPLFQYTIDGQFFRKWDSGMDVAREGYKDVSNIQSNLTNSDRTTNYNFIWTKEFMGEKIEPMIFKDRSSTCKPIGMYDLDDNLIKQFKSQTHAAKEMGISQSSVASVLRGKSKTCLKHKWKYINENS